VRGGARRPPRPFARPRLADLLGAHVSTAGGIVHAPARGKAVGATAIQVFTKSPSQWREPVLDPGLSAAFRAELARCGIRAVTSHDSYLINLASPDTALRRRSIAAFTAELARAEALGIPLVVSHPGNYRDRRAAGLTRNALAYASCLAAVPGRVRIAIETTAGTGTSLGSTFEELAALIAAIPAALRDRVAVCADTCHLYAAGYDLVGDFDGVWREFDRVLGRSRLVCLHLNDSKTPLGSRRDRHEVIGAGTLGMEPFRRLMTEPRFRSVIKVIETPKGDDPVENDQRTLRRLRAQAARARGPG
jgi:deoxyribonuclease-4